MSAKVKCPVCEQNIRPVKRGSENWVFPLHWSDFLKTKRCTNSLAPVKS